MINRRGFIAALLAAPAIGRLKPATAPAYGFRNVQVGVLSSAYDDYSGFELRGLNDDGTTLDGLRRFERIEWRSREWFEEKYPDVE